MSSRYSSRRAAASGSDWIEGNCIGAKSWLSIGTSENLRREPV
ncbi:hypothetical protein AB0M35_21105 [Micromonospora sp. NPDC051196]